METCMKKRFLSIFAVMLALCMAIFASGCDACSNKVILSFTNNFWKANATNAPSAEYTEHLTYSVHLENEYNRIKKSSSLTSDLAEYDFNGTYTMDFSLTSLPSSIETSIEIPNNSDIYLLRTQLKLNAWYKVGGSYAPSDLADEQKVFTDKEGGTEYQDFITTEVYFLPAGHSFAPIYAKTEQVMTSLNYVEQKFNVSRDTSSTETIYNSNSYQTKTTSNNDSFTNSCEYDFKCAIDNTQLLFALRALKIEAEKTFSLPTISPAYTMPQTLTVENTVENSTTKSIDGTLQNIPVKNLSINRSDQYNTGISQYALVQKISADQTDGKALLIEYAAPLMTYGTYLQMGALVYTLTATK